MADTANHLICLSLPCRDTLPRLFPPSSPLVRHLPIPWQPTPLTIRSTSSSATTLWPKVLPRLSSTDWTRIPILNRNRTSNRILNPNSNPNPNPNAPAIPSTALFPRSDAVSIHAPSIALGSPRASPLVRMAATSSAGAQRPLTRANLRLAQRIAELCVPQIFQIFWSRHPFRAFVMVALSFVRGTFPVFKGYTHALIINEASPSESAHAFVPCSQSPAFSDSDVCSLPVTTHGPILIRLVGAEFLRLAAEKALDSFA
jgi:hypothetical protein